MAQAADPGARRRLILGAAAAALLVVSGGLTFAVIGEQDSAQTAAASRAAKPSVLADVVPSSVEKAPVVAASQPVPVQIAEPTPQAETDVVSQFAQTALAALRSPDTPAAQPPAPNAAARMAENNRLYRMVAEAVAQGQSDAYIDRMLNLAHQRGEITVPPGLIKPDGTVDTQTVVALFAGG